MLCQSPSESVKALFFNAGSRQTAFWSSSEIVSFCLKNPSKIRWRLDDLRKLLGPFRRLTLFLDNRSSNLCDLVLYDIPYLCIADIQLQRPAPSSPPSIQLVAIIEKTLQSSTKKALPSIISTEPDGQPTTPSLASSKIWRIILSLCLLVVLPIAQIGLLHNQICDFLFFIFVMNYPLKLNTVSI